MRDTLKKAQTISGYDLASDVTKGDINDDQEFLSDPFKFSFLTDNEGLEKSTVFGDTYKRDNIPNLNEGLPEFVTCGKYSTDRYAFSNNQMVNMGLFDQSLKLMQDLEGETKSKSKKVPSWKTKIKVYRKEGMPVLLQGTTYSLLVAPMRDDPDQKEAYNVPVNEFQQQLKKTKQQLAQEASDLPLEQRSLVKKSKDRLACLVINKKKQLW